MRAGRTLLTSLYVIGVITTGEAAFAKGCVKGAIVGGTIGHFAGRHGVPGAAAGCLYGRHEAHKPQKKSHSQYGPPGQNRAPPLSRQHSAPQNDERDSGIEI